MLTLAKLGVQLPFAVVKVRRDAEMRAEWVAWLRLCALHSASLAESAGAVSERGGRCQVLSSRRLSLHSHSTRGHGRLGVYKYILPTSSPPIPAFPFTAVPSPIQTADFISPQSPPSLLVVEALQAKSFDGSAA